MGPLAWVAIAPDTDITEQHEQAVLRVREELLADFGGAGGNKRREARLKRWYKLRAKKMLELNVVRLANTHPSNIVLKHTAVSGPAWDKLKSDAQRQFLALIAPAVGSPTQTLGFAARSVADYTAFGDYIDTVLSGAGLAPRRPGAGGSHACIDII